MSKYKMTPDKHRKLASKYDARAKVLQEKLDKANHYKEVHEYKADHTRKK